MLVMVPLRLASDPVFSTFYSDRKYPLLGRKYPFAATRAGGRPESGPGHGVSVSVRIAVKPDNRSESDCTVLDFRCPLGLIYLSQSQISMGQYPQRMRPKQVVPLALAPQTIDLCTDTLDLCGSTLSSFSKVLLPQAPPPPDSRKREPCNLGSPNR